MCPLYSCLAAGGEDRDRAEPITARPSSHPQEVLVYAASGQACSGDLFV